MTPRELRAAQDARRAARETAMFRTAARAFLREYPHGDDVDLEDFAAHRWADTVRREAARASRLSRRDELHERVELWSYYIHGLTRAVAELR
jgi:hypothetical protein